MPRLSLHIRTGIRRTCRTSIVLSLMFSASGAWAATESEIKAVMLLGFAQLSEWTTPLPAAAKFRICLLGPTEIEPALRAAAKGESAHDRPIRVARIESLMSASSCQILFVSEAQDQDDSLSLDEAENSNALFVGDFPGFTELGGAIEFYSEEGRVRFAIRRSNAHARGVRLSSRILSRARLLEDDE